MKTSLKRCLAPYLVPTLMRRIFVTSVMANIVFTMVVLVELILTEATIDTPQRVREAKHSSAILERSGTEAQAIMFVNALASTYEWSPDAPILIELWNRHGQRLFHETKKMKFAYAPLLGDPQKLTPVVANGHRYNLIRQDGPRWSLRIAIPQPAQPIHEYIVDYANDNVFLTRSAVYFPMVMLALWLAVWRGLLPLRTLQNRIAQREATDLAPLDFDARYGELKPTVAALDSLLLRLRGKVSREQGFIQNVAHELRTPMAGITAHVTMLISATSTPDKQQAERAINAGIERASYLIQQLLDLARVEGMRPLDNTLQDIAQLVRTDLAQMVPGAMRRQIEILLDAPETLMHRLERNTFQLILHNLLDNAIRYGNDGGTVEVTLKKEGGAVWLIVADDGPGIDISERERVFERFYRGQRHAVAVSATASVFESATASAGEFLTESPTESPTESATESASASASAPGTASGSGLGLALVRQAALRLGGGVELSAGLLGKGCRLTVHIPAR